MIEVIYILFGKGLLLRKDHIKLNFYEHWDKSVSFNENNCQKKKPLQYILTIIMLCVSLIAWKTS